MTSAFGLHGRKCQCDWSKYACPEHGFEDRMAMREAFDEAEEPMDYTARTPTRDCEHGRLARSCETCELEQEVELLRAALRRIERLKDRWDAPLHSLAGDMSDPAYAASAAWAAVGSEAHKIAVEALR